MKKTLLIAAATGLMAVSSFAQGTLVFANTAIAATKINTNVLNGSVRGLVGLTPGFLNYGLFVGASGTTSNNLTLALNSTGGAALVTGNSTTATGRLDGDGGGSFVGISGFAASTPIAVQVRAWSASYGNDWQSAFNAYAANTPGVWWGASIVGSLTLNPVSGPGTALFSSTTPITGFDVYTTVPEPSTIALGMLGLASLAFLRRRNK